MINEKINTQWIYTEHYIFNNDRYRVFVMQITCVHQVILISVYICTVFTFYI